MCQYAMLTVWVNSSKIMASFETKQLNKGLGMRKGLLLLLGIGLAGFVQAGTVDVGAVDASFIELTTFGDTRRTDEHAGWTGEGHLGYNNNANSGFTVASDCAFTNIIIRYASSSGSYNLSVEDTGSTLSTSGDVTTFEDTDSWSTWTTISISLSGDEGDFLHLAYNSGGGVNVDYIEFQAVPEPATASLMALVGGLGFLIRRHLLS